MKILAVGDLHGRYQAIPGLLDSVHPDLMVLNGDLTHFGTPEDLEHLFALVRDVPAWFNWGNCDPAPVAAGIRESGRDLAAGLCLKEQELGFFGLSGSNKTPFHTPSEYSEDVLYQSLRAGYAAVKHCRRTLLFSHVPPYKTKTDRTAFFLHAGSRALRRFLQENALSMCVCGHIHEARGQDLVGETPVYNIGAFKNKAYAVITVTPRAISLAMDRL